MAKKTVKKAKKTTIKRSFSKLKKEIKKIPIEFREVPNSLIDKIIEIEKHLFDLQLDIKKNGVIEIYENGIQKTRRVNPALSAYQQELKNYNATIKAISDFLTKYQEIFKKQDNDGELDDFYKESENR